MQQKNIVANMSTLSKQSTEVLKTKMCIDTHQLLEKIDSPAIQSFSQLICDAIEVFCTLLATGASSEKINNHFNDVTNDTDINSKAHLVLDSLRNTFVVYMSGGLHSLFIYQENESWHPRIELIEPLEPNDIKDLPKQIVIYRGCDKSEHESGHFGQSWTTNLEVAKKFAYNHYEGQEWYFRKNRVVVEARCSREDLLFSSQSLSGEFQVAVKAGVIGGTKVVA